MLPVVGAIVAALLLAVIGGYVRSRRRPVTETLSVKDKGGPLKNPTIDLDTIPAPPAHLRAAEPEPEPEPQAPTMRGPRRLSTARLHDMSKPTDTDIPRS